MRKKLLTLFLAITLVFSNSAIAFAADTVETLTEPTEMANAIPTATGKQAVDALTDGNSVVIDLRAANDYEKAHMEGSINLPVCLSDYSVTTEQRDNFVNYVTKNIDSNKKIYLVCYVGTFCVNFAAKWLTDPVDANGCGFKADNLYRVTGGVWKDADLATACVTTYDKAYNAVLAGTGLVLDVRQTANYDKGHMDLSLHQPLFYDEGGIRSDGTDSLATNFNAFVQANKALFSSKDVYVLCNGGEYGVSMAAQLLKAAEINNVYAIKGGANNSGITTAGVSYWVTNQSVSGENAVAAVGNPEFAIIDVRTPDNYAKGHLRGSLSMPVFDANGVTNGYDTLAMDFLASVERNADTLKGKTIYLLCNRGQSGAKAATKLLMQAGYSNARIYTIEGGAADETVKAAFVKNVVIDSYNFVSGTDAVNAASDKVFIIDVRTEANYQKGHLSNSVNWPLFDANGVTNLEDALADAFLQKVDDNKDKLAGKDIYILCNSGQKGAQSATKLLVGAGYDNKNIFTITDGAKGLEVRYAFLGANPTKAVTGTQTVEAIGKDNIVILDVRASGNYASGHLKGAISLPVFTSKGVIATAADELGVAFIDYAKANKDAWSGKEIYIVCNSGQKGARAATILLKDAGFDLSKVHTVTGGAKGTDTDKSVPNALTYVSDTHALNNLNNKDYLILDVRSADKYAAGHLNGSLSLPVFDKDNKITDDLTDAFAKYVKANKDTFNGKTILILCNSGSRGAEKATELLKAADITPKGIYTIEGGAKSTLLQQSFVPTNTSSSATTTKPSTSPQTGDSANTMIYVLAMGISLLAVLTVYRRKIAK